MNGWFENLIDVMFSMPDWLVLIISFVIPFLEAIVIVGLFVPGTVLMSLLGVLAHQSEVGFLKVYLIAIVASVLGWSISYYLGRLSQSVLRIKFLAEYFTPERVRKAEDFFCKYGGPSLFLARFLGPMRPVFPYAGGLFGLPVKTFWIWNVLSGLAWTLVYIGGGYLLGMYAMEYLEKFSKIASVFSVLVAIFIVLGVSEKFRLKIAKSTLNIFTQIYTFFVVNRKIIMHGMRHVLLLTVILLSALWVLYKLHDPQRDLLIFTNLQQINYPAWVSWVFWFVQYAGEWKVVLVFAWILAFVLYLVRKVREAFVVAFLPTFVAGLVILFKWLFAYPRPEFALHLENGYSFPSGHTAMIAAIVFSLLYVVYTSKLSNILKYILTVLMGLLVLFTAYQRVYLGVHVLPDVVASFFVVGYGLAVTRLVVKILFDANRLSSIKWLGRICFKVKNKV